VQSLAVIEADPVQDLVLGVLEGGEASSLDELAFEGRETQASAIALSYASPREPTEGAAPSSSSRSV